MFILMMLAVGFATLGLLVWAAAYHNVRGYSPTTADKIIASFVFWSTLLAPIVIGLSLAFLAIDTRIKPQWPILELLIIGFLLLVIFGSQVAVTIYEKLRFSEYVGHIIAIVAIGAATLNARLGIRDRKWMKAALSTLTVVGGTIVLLVFNGWAVYWE